jgi:hypothetical protein
VLKLEKSFSLIPAFPPTTPFPALLATIRSARLPMTGR